VGNAELAEDVVQATFLVLVRKAGSIRRRDSTASWLYGVASRIARQARLAETARRQRECRAARPQPVQGPTTPSGNEAGPVLDEELLRLPDRYRAPLVLCYVEGHTRAAAARLLHCSLRTVDRRVREGVELLRSRLAARGVAPGPGLLGCLLAGATAQAGLSCKLRQELITMAMARGTGRAVRPLLVALAHGGMRVSTTRKVQTALAAVILIGAGTGLAAWRASSAETVGATTAATAPETPALTPDARQTVPASRGGVAQTFEIDSAILKEKRRVQVILPASFSQSAAGRRYPVTVVVDGDYLMAPVAAVCDELTRKGQIPESVIVGIENIGGADDVASNRKRVHDLTPPGLSVSGSGLNEGGDLFLDFIEKELLPEVDRQFRAAAPRTFVGISSGGILATYAAATRSTYRTVVALDAPVHLGNNWLAKKLIARAGRAGEPVRYASLEARFGWPDGEWKALAAAAPASWKLYRERFWPKESHESVEMIGTYIGLRQLYDDYSMHAAPVAPTTSILPHYAKVGASLGATVVPPRKLLQQVVDDLIAEGRGAAAREAYRLLEAGFGPPANSAALVARITECERRPPPAETVEGLLATPFPGPEEVKEYLGEWVGDVLMKPDQPRTGATKLRIRVVNGRVVGETVHSLPEGDELVRKWEYLKVTPRGLTWGYLNGMRPRGVVLFEGKRDGDILSGRSRFGGIDARTPDGSPVPSPSFSFKRLQK
jgi:RNA polymerase sigma factor (sigma-70 family)